MPDRTFSTEILLAALEGLESQHDRVVARIAEVRRMLGTAPVTSTAELQSPTRKPRRKMSAAARKRMAAAQRRRWEAIRKASWGISEAAPKPTAKTAKAAPAQKRTISAAGRKRIAEATRKRWAEFRKKTKQSAATSKSAARKKAGQKTARRKRATEAAVNQAKSGSPGSEAVVVAVSE